MHKTIAATLALAAGWAGAALAQDVDRICNAIGQIAVGQWAEYHMSQTTKDAPTGGRFAVIGTEEVGGSDYYWYETAVETNEGRMIVQVLIPGYPYSEDDIQGLVMKAGDQPAMKVPPSMLDMMKRMMQTGTEDATMTSADRCGEGSPVGWETVTVPAGTFRTLHVRTSEPEAGDLWVTTDVPFGMVKVVSADGLEMVLSGHGMDATSSITEVPQDMPGMPGMPSRRP